MYLGILCTLLFVIFLTGILLLFYKFPDLLPAREIKQNNDRQDTENGKYIYANGKKFDYDEVRETNTEYALMFFGLILAIAIALT